MPEVRFELMRPDEILKEKKECSFIFLPLGPLEWHGPHLPMGVDPLNAYMVALELAKRIGGVVLPPLFVGTERERSSNILKSFGFEGNEYIVGMDFSENLLPSLYLKEEVFAVLLRNYLELLQGCGYKAVIIVNGHGAENHLNVIERLCKEFNSQANLKVLAVMPMPKDKNGQISGGHANRTETSLVMKYFPSRVNLRSLPTKNLKLLNTKWAIVDAETFRGNPTPDFTVRKEEDPRYSSSQEGEEAFQLTINQLAEEIRIFEKELGR